MAVTAVVCEFRPNRQRWILTQDGNAGSTITLTTTGQPTNDLLTYSAPGKIRQLTKTFTDGYGAFPAGALTQAQARALWLSDRSGANPGQLLMTGRCEFTPRTGTTAPIWIVDANVDGSGHPTIAITAPAAAGVAYLDVELEGGAVGA